MNNYYLPLSYAQKRVWHLDNFMNQNFGFVIFNVPYIIEIEGDLNIEVLNKSINFLIQRHSSLRTGIKEKDGEPFQQVHDTINYRIVAKKINNGEFISKKDIQVILEQEVNHKFNLNDPPLFRVTLLEIGNNKYILLFLFHHIISDEWSVGIFSQELSSLYSSYLNGCAPKLSKLESSYCKFIIWHKTWFEGDVFNNQLNYWEKKLSNYKLLKIPFDKEHTAFISKSGSYRFKIDEELTKKLKELGNKYGTTLFITLLAVYKVVLYRIYNQDDILVGSPISNRHHEGVENMIGCFVNVVMLRTQIKKNDPFTSLLYDIKISALDAYDNQDMPFDSLMENLGQEKGYEKYFIQLFFEMKNSKNYLLNFPGTVARWYNNLDIENLINQSRKIMSKGNSIDIEIEYSADLYNETTFSLLSDNFMFVINQIINNPNIKIEQISLLHNGKSKYPTSNSTSVFFNPQAYNTAIEGSVINKINRYIKFSVKEIELPS